MAGRVGVSGAWVSTEWVPEAPFFEVRADQDGRYTMRGIPASWPIEFTPYVPGSPGQVYEDTFEWHEFSVDTTLDLELTRR